MIYYRQEVTILADNSDTQWLTIAEAATRLGVSDRTIRRRIDKEEYETKLENGLRYVCIDSRMSIPSDNIDREAPSLIRQLRSEIDHLRKQNEALLEQISDMQEAAQQQNAIAMQLTRQLDQDQRLLEYHREPWWKRWRMKLGSGKRILDNTSDQ